MLDGSAGLQTAPPEDARMSGYARSLPFSCPRLYSDPDDWPDRASADGAHLSGVQ
jgi:hypothetical protein